MMLTSTLITSPPPAGGDAWPERAAMTILPPTPLGERNAEPPCSSDSSRRSTTTTTTTRTTRTTSARTSRTLFFLALAVMSSTSTGSSSGSGSTANTLLPYPSLKVFETFLRTTAQDSYNGHPASFEAAARWTGGRLDASDDAGYPRDGPHLVCAEYEQGREAIARLKFFLSPEAVRPVVHSKEHGSSCFIVSASRTQAWEIATDPEFLVASIAPFPVDLKVAPGVLDHGDAYSSTANGRDDHHQSEPQQQQEQEEEGGGQEDTPPKQPGTTTVTKLGATHGPSMRLGNTQGLSVELSPGTLPAKSPEARSSEFIAQMKEDLMSDSIDLYAGSVWSDPAMSAAEHLSTTGGAARGRDWTLAAALVQGAARAAGVTPGDVCAWGRVSFHHAGDDLLLLSGLDHLLYTEKRGRGREPDQKDNEEEEDEEVTELRVACFMGLVSSLSGRVEVLRVAPRHKARLLNAAARATIQSATPTLEPLTLAGLDGTGEVIQVIDSGLDETSCFFIDTTGETIPHGYFYDELGYIPSSTSTTSAGVGGAAASTSEVVSETSYMVGPSDYYQIPGVYKGGDLTAYPERRKIIQYIDLIKSDALPSSHGSSFTTTLGDKAPWFPGDGFELDDVVGHGTHTAGSAAGATLNSPAELVTCEGTKTMGCVGGCIESDGLRSEDDVVTSMEQSNFFDDLDRICPEHECDELTEDWCLSDDVPETLTAHGGMARGAKLAIFDGFASERALLQFPGNGLWESCLDADCKIHSNSWGVDNLCTLTGLEVLYDDFMYQNQENLIVFAAGNDGDVDRFFCTMGAPAIGKNVLAVGATSSGESRLTATGADGLQYDGSNRLADVDTVAYFSSYGPTDDGRIKPEVVAPGDAIYSAGGDGTDSHSCRLWAYSGTSMSCPIVAGAAAMVRQYFVDETFYLADVTGRGWCANNSTVCEAFSPSSATVKAMLINSANLMGGSAEPDGHRGFGRIHLEMGMPLAGETSLGLFVADSAQYSLADGAFHEFSFEVDATASLDFRATISWIDPPASAYSFYQLINNLDLVVTSPSGTDYTMWESGITDSVNVNERVLIPAADVESGTYTVQVTADSLTTSAQKYSLVVNGAITPVAGSSEPPSAPSPIPPTTSSDYSGSPSSGGGFPSYTYPPYTPYPISPSSFPTGTPRTFSPLGFTPATFSPLGTGADNDEDDDDSSGYGASPRATSGAAMGGAKPFCLPASIGGAVISGIIIAAAACMV